MNSGEAKPAWPHAPRHQLQLAGTYMVTGATYQKEHYFRTAKSLEYLHDRLLDFTASAGWQLEAWAVFSNHYHFIAHSPEGEESAASLKELVHRLHNRTAQWVNDGDGTSGRKVWHNYWESRLTFHNSYLARLHYVHENAVKHGLVASSVLYPWCSAGCHRRTASRAMQKALERFEIGKVQVADDFEPVVVVEKE